MQAFFPYHKTSGGFSLPLRVFFLSTVLTKQPGDITLDYSSRCTDYIQVLMSDQNANMQAGEREGKKRFLLKQRNPNKKRGHR